MSSLWCKCGNRIADTTDFLPYKAHIRADEDTEKPIELLVDSLERFWEAREHGQQDDFLRHWDLSRGEDATTAEWDVEYYRDKPLASVLYHLIYSVWNQYERTIYECDECGRLWVELEPRESNHYAPYLPETEARHLLWSPHDHNPYGLLKE